MRLHPIYRSFLFFATIAALSGQICAQQLSCAQVHAMAEMVRARSTSQLNPLRTSAGNNYRAQLVFAFRALELQPTKLTASAVLDFLPKDDSHREEWYSLSGWICDGEQDQDVKSLAQLQGRMSRDFAKSVILSPTRMYQYVSYPVIIGLDPHDDYAEKMTAVCRRRPREFAAAIDQLPEKERTWLRHVVFEPSGCRALAHPEAE
jgi:hypothetical protein